MTAASPFAADPVVVEVVRNGIVESVHHGRVAVTAPDGALLSSLGDAFAPIYPRSSSKPLQAVGMLRTGLQVSAERLAVVCASHSGEEFHQAAVLAVLGTVGLDADVLQTPASWPLDDAAREAAIRAGGFPTPLAMNCSVKHAGMIATSKRNDWPIESYRDPDHPVQLAILTAIDELAGEQGINLAMDGCGAPLYAISLAGLARAFGRLAVAEHAAEAQVRSAILTHPEYVSGTHRDELALHRAVPGLIAKAGAEAVYAVGLPDGRGVAIKISDGSARARPVAMAGVLQALGFDHPTLGAQASGEVLGHGERAGEIRPAAAIRDLG